MNNKLNNIDTHIYGIASIVDTIIRYPIDIDDTTFNFLYSEPIININNTYTAYQNDINNATANKLQTVLEQLQEFNKHLHAFYVQNPQKAERAQQFYLNPYNEADALIDRAIRALPIPQKYTSTSQQVEAPTEHQSAHFEAKMTYQQAQSLLSALQQNGYIDTSTTADTFYYRMTGNGRPVTDKIIWTKTARSKDINLASIIDFVSLLNIQLGRILDNMGNVFIKPNNIVISLSSSTKAKAKGHYRNNTPYSESHNELKRIKEEVLQ